jgi:Ca-activated chloride channel family protein
MLNKEDFNDDKKDAGELGSGHTVTALYEIIPVGVESNFLKNVDDLKYQKNKKTLSTDARGNEMMTIKFRYKDPQGDRSSLIEHAVIDKQIRINNTSDNFRFAASVAQFGMLLRNSEYKGTATYQDILKLATNSKGKDEEGYRNEFISLIKKASSIANNKQNNGDLTFDDN